MRIRASGAIGAIGAGCDAGGARAPSTLCAIAASQVHWARNIPWKIASGMLPWSASASPKKARNRRWCSASSVSTRAGRNARCSGVSASKPFVRAVCTTSRGALTPNMRIPFSRANTKMSR
jgi:hypothetical protein